LMSLDKEQKQQMDIGRINFKVQFIIQFLRVFSMLFGCGLLHPSLCKKESSPSTSSMMNFLILALVL
jgi:uncharacterized membrane protein YeiB